MKTRFSKRAKVFDIGVTAVAALLSVGIMLFGVFHYGLSNTWPELVLNLFYIACLVMMWMYFFDIRITTQQFNYWSSVCVGITILLRDILFAPPLIYNSSIWLAPRSPSCSSSCSPFSMHVRNGRPTPRATSG